ncbi:MAG: hypothetical protein ACXAB2_04990 [Candidatus Hodarchaeales archaeon]|jgi:uncharacterized membrane protein
MGNILDVRSDIRLLLILGSILPDFDYILGLYHNRNHRQFPTHYPIIWVSLTFLSFFLSDFLFWICFGGLVHLLVDLIDWELFVFGPFTDSTWSILSLDFELIKEKRTIKEFLVAYYSVSWIIVVELSTILLYTFTLIFQ